MLRHALTCLEQNFLGDKNVLPGTPAQAPTGPSGDGRCSSSAWGGDCGDVRMDFFGEVNPGLPIRITTGGTNVRLSTS